MREYNFPDREIMAAIGHISKHPNDVVAYEDVLTMMYEHIKGGEAEWHVYNREFRDEMSSARGRDMRTGRYTSRGMDEDGYSGHYPMNYIDPMYYKRRYNLGSIIKVGVTQKERQMIRKLVKCN